MLLTIAGYQKLYNWAIIYFFMFRYEFYIIISGFFLLLCNTHEKSQLAENNEG